MKPEGSVEFAHDIQFEHFYNGKNINERDVYVELAKNHDVDADELLKRMNDDEFHKITMNEFEQIKKMGIKEYPVVLGQTNKGIYALSKGFIPEKDMTNIFEMFKKTVEKEIAQ
jgi:predicted DsbA family dithiol-disulfide isomerase